MVVTETPLSRHNNDLTYHEYQKKEPTQPVDMRIF